MKNVENMLRQAHDVLYDELNRNVRDMTVTESDFIRDCLDKMDSWIKDAEGRFGRADTSQSKKFVKSSSGKDWMGIPGVHMIWHGEWADPEIEHDGVVANYIEVEENLRYEAENSGVNADNDAEFDEFIRKNKNLVYELIDEAGERGEIESGCHGKSDKRRRERKEDELESSRRSVKSSPDINLRNRARELFRRFDSLTPDSKEDILTRFNVTDEDDLADYVMAYGNASVIDELDDAIAEAEGGIKSSRNARTFSKFNHISSLFIKNDFFAEGEECIVEIKEDGKWKMVSLDNTPEGWSTKKKAKVFKSEKDARKSALIGRLNDAGYSEEAGNLRFSVN